MTTSFTLGSSTNNKEAAGYPASSTVLTNGNVVVTYYVLDTTGAPLANGMFYRVYDPQMVAITGPLPVVVDANALGESNGTVVATDDGGFIIMHQLQGLDTAHTTAMDLYAKKFDALGNATSPDTLIERSFAGGNAVDNGGTNFKALVTDSGNIVLSYSDSGANFDAAGNAVAAPSWGTLKQVTIDQNLGVVHQDVAVLPLNDTLQNFAPSGMVELANGNIRYVGTAIDRTINGLPQRIYTVETTANGTLVSGPTTIEYQGAYPAPSLRYDTQLVERPDGGFYILHEQHYNVQTASAFTDVYVRNYDANGNLLTGPTKLTTLTNAGALTAGEYLVSSDYEATLDASGNIVLVYDTYRDVTATVRNSTILLKSVNPTTGAVVTGPVAVGSLPQGGFFRENSMQTLADGSLLFLGANANATGSFGTNELLYGARFTTSGTGLLPGQDLPDGIVTGTAGNDLINVAYLGDPEGDRVDNSDATNGIGVAGSNDDSIRAGDGNDTVVANLGNDTVDGGTGADSIDGGAGADNLVGGLGNDILIGGAGDDDIFVGGSDTATGGSGDDVFSIDVTDTATNVNVTLDGGTDGTSGNRDDTANGDAGDLLDLSVQTQNLTVTLTTNPETGTVNGLDADVGTDISFTEIERILTGSGDDTVVGGTATTVVNVDTGAGNDSIASGSGNDTIAAGSGNDTVASGAGQDTVDGGDGNDSINGGAGKDSLLGGAGADTLIGGLGNDVLSGGAGDDDIFVGGADTAAGGSGDDVFSIDTTDTAIDVAAVIDGGTDATDGNPDDSANGDAGDALDLSAQTQNLTVNLTANSETGTVNGLDADVGTDISFTEIEKLLTGSGNDMVAGATATGPVDVSTGAGDDVITTGAGNDSIDAGSGNDSVAAGAGNDTVAGGLGSDTLRGGLGADVLDGGAGDDDIFVGGADTATGGSGDDVFSIDTTDTAIDVAAVIDGGTDATDGHPDDTANGDAGDALDLSAQTQNLTVNLTANSETGTVNGLDADAGTDISFAEIEKLLTGSGNDTVAGATATGPVNIDTGAGNDTIATGSGNDTIVAGSGDDTVAAGAGNDSVFGGDGNDSLAGGDGNDSVDGGLGNDSLSGGEGADTLNGGDGADTMNGGNGDDSLAGGLGNDSIIGSEGSDTVDGGDGDDFINTRTSPGLGAPDIGLVYPNNPATPANETLLYSYTADTDPNNDRDSVVGGNGNDTILTGDDADTVYGGSGNDAVDAGFDDDIVYGGIGKDSVQGSEGRDTVYGEDGDDVIYGGLSPADPNYAASAIYDLEDDGANTSVDPVANNNTDLLYGGDGNDRIYGQDDADTLYGDVGDDTLDGGIDNDILFGGDGNDQLIGGQGNDTLDGGVGVDTLSGGIGADVFKADGTADLLSDFDVVTGIGDAAVANDFVDLSAYYNATTLAAWNAANPTQTYTTALDWLRADQADGTLQQAGGLRIQNGGAAVAGSGLFRENTAVMCFVRGTDIKTIEGEISVEQLAVGTEVLTRDSGYEAIRWIGSRLITKDELLANPNLRPIRIKAGALGHNLPETDLVVSPQHRVLVRSDLGVRMFGDREVLIAAKQLVGLDGFDVVMDCEEVEYWHFLFDAHQIVYSNGAATESLFTGPEALKSVSPEAKAEILEIFPELMDIDTAWLPTPVRQLIKGSKARQFTERLIKNGKSLVA